MTKLSDQLVTIRPVKAGDQAALAALLSDRQTVEASGLQLPDPDDVASWQWALNILVTKDRGLWLVIERASNSLAGVMSLVPSTTGFDLGYLLGPTFRGRGLMTSAVKLLLTDLRRQKQPVMVTASTSISNVASQRVLQRAGFQRLTPGEDRGVLQWCWTTQSKKIQRK
ncbi:GNAT family N-acetyltransferase [uncultured Limosilactobacillus sp.]|uniref:GNAT family N-acetyltransferase n=1 Tax=uncultured Limosilactobacillus sp. TaxID=2837629 RepID=UPI00260070E3|nr:GNAT family N-acetyltransferase [uncultured Limosilactobacillus sp.]